MKYVLITGVSTGIGRATAEMLVTHGYQVIGSVRRVADAEKLQEQLGERFTPVEFDVTDQPAVADAARRVTELLDGRGLTGLINNAGIAVGGPLMHQPLDEIRLQFEVNVLGLLSVTQAFLPLLGARHPQQHPPGRLINVSSVSGKLTPPFLGVYSATKHAVEALSNALRLELSIYGIEVVVVEPGRIRTEIWDKAEQEDATAYADTDYADVVASFQRGSVSAGRRGLPPEEVGQKILRALERRRPRARYAVPDQPILGWMLPRLLPDRVLDRLILSQVDLSRKTQ